MDHSIIEFKILDELNDFVAKNNLSLGNLNDAMDIPILNKYGAEVGRLYKLPCSSFKNLQPDTQWVLWLT